MQNKFGVVFGGVIAYILLILYAGSVAYIIRGVLACAAEAACQQRDFNDGIVYVVTTIGGLVSALVISKLTITEPGKNPGIIRMAASDGGQPNKMVTFLAVAYLGVWLLTGLAALLIGLMAHPGINSTLSDIGTTWLGLAVAAGYAYFGLDPSPR